MEGWQVFFEIPGKPPVELADGESIIGRSRNSAVHIPETTVSRQHARVRVNGPGQVDVEDLGSANGTFVNGEKVETLKLLRDGDHVTVGDAELVIRILAPIEPSEATVRVSIPPMTAPAPAGAAPVAIELAVELPTAAPSPVPPPVAAPPPPSAAATVVGPALDLPISAPARPAPLPAPPPAPAASPAATRPAASAAPAVTRPAATMPPPPTAVPAAPPSPKGEVLGSIAEVEKMPLPPAKKGATGALAAPAAATGVARYGGFWIRTLAYVLDMVPVMILAMAGVAVAFLVDPRFTVIVNLLILPYVFWNAWMLPATKGYTLGKKMLGLAIVTEATRPGQGLGWGKAFIRLIGLSISGAVFGVGFLLVAFTSKKQGLHDMIAGTFVVRTK